MPQVPLRELRFAWSRSSGPGGQNVNKVESRVTLRWNVATSAIEPAVRERFMELFGSRLTADGELLLSSQRYRDRQRNRDDVVERLERMLERAARPVRKRRPTRPTSASVEKRIEHKKRRSRLKNERRKRDDQ